MLEKTQAMDNNKIQILPFLFVNAMTQRTFGIQFTDEDLLHRRNLTEGGEQLGYTSLGLNNTWTHTIEAQLGWQRNLCGTTGFTDEFCVVQLGSPINLRILDPWFKLTSMASQPTRQQRKLRTSAARERCPRR